MEAALRRLGSPEALVFSARQFDPASAQRMTGLWNVPGISAGYRHAHALWRAARRGWRACRRRRPRARPCWVDAADPRHRARSPLPEAIQPGAERHAPIDATRAYRAGALAIWETLLQSEAD